MVRDRKRGGCRAGSKARRVRGQKARRVRGQSAEGAAPRVRACGCRLSSHLLSIKPSSDGQRYCYLRGSDHHTLHDERHGSGGLERAPEPLVSIQAGVLERPIVLLPCAGDPARDCAGRLGKRTLGSVGTSVTSQPRHADSTAAQTHPGSASAAASVTGQPRHADSTDSPGHTSLPRSRHRRCRTQS